MAKLWRKLKWLVFFWDTVYMQLPLPSRTLPYFSLRSRLPYYQAR